jgi:hypothetical protein
VDIRDRGEKTQKMGVRMSTENLDRRRVAARIADSNVNTAQRPSIANTNSISKTRLFLPELVLTQITVPSKVSVPARTRFDLMEFKPID